MSFFEKPARAAGSGPGVSAASSPASAVRGDRGGIEYDLMPKDVVRGDPDEPSHRSVTGKGGRVQHSSVVDRSPRGLLFSVDLKFFRGYFDLDGYWVTKDAKNKVTVRRSAPRKVTTSLKELQKQALHRARLNARRAGTR